MYYHRMLAMDPLMLKTNIISIFVPNLADSNEKGCEGCEGCGEIPDTSVKG
jgi:hypothetical protein